MLALKTILHPTDFSPQAEQAFQLACSLARDHGSRLILLHVAPGHEVVMGEFGMPPAEPFEESTLRERLNQLCPPGAAIAVEHLIVQGDPADQILAAAGANQCDLIVLGTHGRTGLLRLLMGSVAEKVVREAPCPVIVAKSPVPEPPAGNG